MRTACTRGLTKLQHGAPDGTTLRRLALDDLIARRPAAGRPKDLRRGGCARRSLRPGSGTDQGPSPMRK
ncbi:MAG TPA: hypothetical protein VF109_12255, partial [Mycobacteriales bacterium]